MFLQNYGFVLVACQDFCFASRMKNSAQLCKPRRNLATILRVLRRVKPDVVHATQCTSLPLVSLACLLTGTPLVSSLHTDLKGRGERPAGRAELRALTLGGAVWGAFRENANCGDPPGTLPVPSRYPPGTLYIPCTFRRVLI